MADEIVHPETDPNPAAKSPIRKTHAWIFDVSGVARKGWLQIIEGAGDAKPADRGWRPMAEFPAIGRGGTRVVLWADDVDKYIARIDVGLDRRWLILEGLPALLNAAASLNAVVQMGLTIPRP